MGLIHVNLTDAEVQAILQRRATIIHRPLRDAQRVKPPADAVYVGTRQQGRIAVFDTHEFGHGVHWSAKLPGRKGDTLVGKECWSHLRPGPGYAYREKDGHLARESRYSWSSAAQMPPSAVRIRRKVVAVSVLPVQVVTIESIRAAGWEGGKISIPNYPFSAQPMEQFRYEWNARHAAAGFAFDDNPWCVSIEFEPEVPSP
jgi:hypothetical protein